MHTHNLKKWCLCLLISASLSHGINAMEGSSNIEAEIEKVWSDVKNIKIPGNKQKLTWEQLRYMMLFKKMAVVQYQKLDQASTGQRSKKDWVILPNSEEPYLNARETLQMIQSYSKIDNKGKKNFLMTFHNVFSKTLSLITRESLTKDISERLGNYDKFVKTKKGKQPKKLLPRNLSEEDEKLSLYNAVAINTCFTTIQNIESRNIVVIEEGYSRYKAGRILIVVFIIGSFVGVVYNEVYRDAEEAKKNNKKGSRDRQEEDDDTEEDDEEVITKVKRKPKKTSQASLLAPYSKGETT